MNLHPAGIALRQSSNQQISTVQTHLEVNKVTCQHSKAGLCVWS